MSRPITVASVIANAKGGFKRQTFGQSLYLVVRGGSARWEYQFRDPATKRIKSVWLGSAIGPDAVSPTAARIARAAKFVERKSAPTVVSANLDIQDRIESVNNSLPVSNGLTFGEALHAYIGEHAPHWRGGAEGREAKQWRSSLANSSLAPLTLVQINEATKRDALMVFPQVQRERVRSRVNAVVEFMVSGRSAPRRPKVAHMPAMAWGEVPSFFDLLAHVEGSRALVARALRWTILTACRAGDTLGMTWGEVNGDWVIPGERHKSGEEFRIPLTEQMRACLPAERGADGDRVFPMGAMEMVRLLHRCHADKTLTVHGFRTSFSTWAADRGADLEVRETCLAHKFGNAVMRSYQRSDLFERRRELMQTWADHVTGKPVQSATVAA
jgi:integrase